MKTFFTAVCISFMMIVQAAAQPLADTIQCVKIEHIERPFGDNYNVRIKTIYQDEKLYVMACSRDGRIFQEGVPAFPSIQVYVSAGRLESSYEILDRHYELFDFCKTEDRFFVCGLYLSDDSVTTENYNRQRYSYSEGFIAEYSSQFELKNIQRFPGMNFWKVFANQQSVYLLGAMIQKEVKIGEQKFNSFVEIKADKKNKNEQDYHDAVLLKLDRTLTPQKFGHYAIDGSFQDGESLIVNNNGYALFAVNTCVLRGSDHHDGNLFLVDTNFNMLWHKQYTDLGLGTYHATPVSFNADNEILALVSSYYCLESRNASLLPSYRNIEEKKNMLVFDGIIKYNEKGVMVSKQQHSYRNMLQPEFSNTFTVHAMDNRIGYLQLSSVKSDSTACLIYDLITPEGMILPQNYLPERIPPLLFCCRSNNPYNWAWEIITLSK